MTNNRITLIDALRGFALLGVVLVHTVSRYTYYSFGGEVHEPFWNGLDAFVGWLSANVLSGRFINVFAFLFGLSFFIQMDRAAAKGVDFRRRFLWRMAVLFIIGFVDTIFYSGDILTLYAIMGVIMVALYKWKNWALILLAVMLLCGAPRLGITMLSALNQTTTTPEIALSSADSLPEGDVAQMNPAEWNAENNPARSFIEQMGQQSLAESVKTNMFMGLFGKVAYQFFMSNRGFITLALFILGFVIGRMRFFETVHLYPRRNLVLMAIFASALVGVNWIIKLFPQENAAAFMMGGVQNYESVIVMSLGDISTVLFSATMVMTFVVLYEFPVVGKCLSVLAPYGRMGLTNYVGQSIIGAVLFAPWAFGAMFGGRCATELFLLGILIYILQVVASKWWLKYFKYGPLEWFWRTATYMKIQPFKR